MLQFYDWKINLSNLTYASRLRKGGNPRIAIYFGRERSAYFDVGEKTTGGHVLTELDLENLWSKLS